MVALCLAPSAWALTGVNPTGVNVNTSGVTSVFLSFQGLTPTEVPVRAYWCAEVTVPANVVVNFDPCVPGTLLGNLPAGNDLGRASSVAGGSLFTDIMTIPASVTRRAYQLARGGEPSAFFYIREFVDSATGVSSFVVVTCRLAGGGARVPLALTQVELVFVTGREARELVPVVAVGETLSPVEARIAYNGTGTLKGRWEVVFPGEEPPDLEDLLPEPSLPPELRGSQRRYTTLSRFDVFLPPTGELVLPGPDPERLPSEAAGPYLLLLRIETSADKEGDSETGAGLVQSGGIAGFPLPVLRYYVGMASESEALPRGRRLIATRPLPDQRLSAGAPLGFTWLPVNDAAAYRVELRRGDGDIASAFIAAGVQAYQAPPWYSQLAGDLHWRVVALDERGRSVESSRWQRVVIEP
ncbi:MAG: hypothetical protein JJT93_12070 [Gammaproteobacteria bacterium]|nr:hypothetical protein [Gammaproteobacteria bacterium]